MTTSATLFLFAIEIVGIVLSVKAPRVGYGILGAATGFILARHFPALLR